MRALLRLQAVLTLRTFATPTHLGALAAIVGFVFAVFVASSERLAITFSLPAFVFGVPVVVMGMAQVLDGMDPVRWVAPVAPRAILGAHLLFWTAASAVAAAGIAVLCAFASPSEAWVVGPVIGAGIVLGGAWAASAAVVLQRIRRMGSRPIWVVAVAVAGGATTVLAGYVVAFIWSGGGALAFPIALCLTLGAGAWMFLREERVPVGSGKTSASRGAGARDQATPATARSPLASLVRASWPPLWTCVWVAMGIGSQFLPAPSDGFTLMWVVIAVLNLAQIGLASWRWLAATSIDRSRAFRMLFLPVVGFAVVAAGLRWLSPELGGDRTVFFRALDTDPYSLGPQSTLVLGQVLDVDGRAHTHLDPEPAFMAERVREHLRAEYGLTVPHDRIEATIRRGWPAQFPPGWGTWYQEAVFPAMDRVHANLEHEIRAADRISRVVDVLAALFAALLVLRAMLAGFTRARVWLLGLGLPAMFVIFLPTFAPESALGVRVTSVRDDVYAVFTGGAPLPLVLLLAGTAAIALLTWRSSLRAFRRLETTDLPPESSTRWHANRV